MDLSSPEGKARLLAAAARYLKDRADSLRMARDRRFPDHADHGQPIEDDVEYFDAMMLCVVAICPCAQVLRLEREDFER